MNVVTKEMQQKCFDIQSMHFDQDSFIKGSYGDTDYGVFKGCSIGCLLYSLEESDTTDHARLSEITNCPEWLLRLNDAIFEGLPNDKNSQFAVDFWANLPTDIDLNTLRPAIQIARLKRVRKTQEGSSYSEISTILSVIDSVITLWEVNEQDVSKWTAARTAATAAERTAESGCAWDSAWAAAMAAAGIAATAAESGCVWDSEWEQEANFLIDLFKSYKDSQ